jgi:uncharacterized protein (TIGR02231 family)
MSLLRRALVLLPALAATLAVSITGHAQDAPLAIEELQVDAPIEAVTLYLGRAAITRRAALDLHAGLYEIQFADLPHTIEPDSLQARATGDVKVVSVDYEVRQVRTAPSQQVAELDAKIEELRRKLSDVEQQRGLIKSQEEMLNALGFRIAGDATNRSGTTDLDLDAVKNQLDFVASERRRLLEEKQKLDQTERDHMEELRIAEAERAALGAGSKESRTAIVTAAATTSGQVAIELVYLVRDASWHPSYNIRAASDLSGAAVEYDAMLLQRTGEDWNDVALTLSTAQPRLAANPPSIDPWFVDIAQPFERRGMMSGAASAPPPGRPADGAMESDARSKALEEWSRDAMVTGSGPAVAFEIPRRISVATNAEKQQRTRIGSFNATADFVYVAVPIHTEAVYLRGDLVNSSPYQLLPGPVAIFLGQDYVGPTHMEAVAPASTLEIHFGIDPAITAERLLVEKETSRTGLLSGGRKTVYAYRIAIDNGTGRQIKLELWDRIPASRSDQIQIDLVDLSTPLATDREYVEEDRPRGLLKWLVNIPASAKGNNAAIISYGIEINRGKDVEMTPLPE